MQDILTLNKEKQAYRSYQQVYYSLCIGKIQKPNEASQTSSLKLDHKDMDDIFYIENAQSLLINLSF